MTSSSTARDDRALVGRHATSRGWTWGAILLSILVCALVSWLHYEQRKALGQARQRLESIRQARIELNQGFLHASLSEYEGSPFRRENGLALLRQSISAFDSTLAYVESADAGASSAFRASVAKFERRLAEWQKAPDSASGKAAALRIAFSDLERQAVQVDAQASLQLFALASRLDRQFAIALAMAVLLLGTISAVVFGAARATERAEAERQRLITAIEQVGDVVVVADPSGAIQYVNPAFETVTGYGRAEAIGNNPRFLKSGLQDEAFYRELWNTISGGRTWQGQLVNKRRDGTIYTEEATISPVLGPGGRIVNYVAIKRDITEQLRQQEEQARLEDQLRQSQKVEAIGRLAGGVAHDFNNMLSIILGYGEIILQELHRDNPMRDGMEQIVQAGRRSAALTSQLLAFGRRQTLQPQVLDLNDVIRNVEKMLHRLIGEDIVMILRPSRNPARVKADLSQLEQVIVNLALNARDAMPQGGKLIIEVAHAELDEQYAESHAGGTPGNYVLLAMTDTGCGMDPQTMSQVFEPFFTTKEKGRGTGLGLATVYGIVKQSGGNVCVYSEPLRGTTFKIYLPRTLEPPESKAGPPPQPVVEGAQEHILVVEDEASLRRLAQTVLIRLNYNVTVAENGGEALSLVAEKGLKPDLVITDVVMPGMNGTVLVERLKKLLPGIKVLYMSGYTDNAIVHHGVLDPGTPFIQKPFSIRELSVKVQQMLRQD